MQVSAAESGAAFRPLHPSHLNVSLSALPKQGSPTCSLDLSQACTEDVPVSGMRYLSTPMSNTTSFRSVFPFPAQLLFKAQNSYLFNPSTLKEIKVWGTKRQHGTHERFLPGTNTTVILNPKLKRSLSEKWSVILPAFFHLRPCWVRHKWT